MKATKRIRDPRRKPTGKPAKFMPPNAIDIGSGFAIVPRRKPLTSDEIDARRRAGYPNRERKKEPMGCSSPGDRN